MFTSWLPFIASFLKSFIELSCWPLYTRISSGLAVGPGKVVQIQAPIMMPPITTTNAIVKIVDFLKRIALFLN